MATCDGERPVVSSSSTKREGTSKQHRETPEEVEESAPVVAQVGGDKAAFSKFPPVEEKRVTSRVFKPPSYSTPADRDSAPLGPSARESPVEIDWRIQMWMEERTLLEEYTQ